eukprot:m.411799 g.411799  ORF g.411799 m.411799 type:complete len:73 (+) comp20166_c11_seq2:139-357(+)
MAPPHCCGLNEPLLRCGAVTFVQGGDANLILAATTACVLLTSHNSRVKARVGDPDHTGMGNQDGGGLWYDDL